MTGVRLNPTVVVLKLFGKRLLEGAITRSQSNRSGFETGRHLGSHRTCTMSQSNRSGFETEDKGWFREGGLKSQSNRSGFETLNLPSPEIA